MTENKKQHFVPRLLQRLFSFDSKTIGCYQIETGNTYQSPISHTAQKDWFYKANEDDKISIEHVFGDLEDSVQPVLQQLQGHIFDLKPDEIETLFLFVIAQLMRTPKAAKAMGFVLDICINKGINAVSEEVNAGIRNKTNLPMQAAITIPKVAEYLSGKGYLFVCNNTGNNFLLSDNPACLFSPVMELAIEKQIMDLMTMQAPFSGYILYMPLGPSVGMICYDNDYYDFGSDASISVTDEDVKVLNWLEVVNASHIVMFQEGSFDSANIKEALDYRNSDVFLHFNDGIYAPIDKTFSLSMLKFDEAGLIYKINRFTIEKPVKKNPLIGF